MILYVIIINDRHADTDIELYESKEKAISRARHLAKKYCKHDEDYEEMEIKDHLFFATYSQEGDDVSVIERELNK